MYDRIPGDFVHGPDVYLDDAYMDEVWEYIQGIPGYMISDHGRVWSEKSKIFLKPKPLDRSGHLGFALSVNGRPHYVYLHRLMAEAFIPNPENYPIVRHLNDMKDDNDLKNLAWGTQRHNWEDSVQNGTAQPPRKEWREIGLKKMRKPVIATNLTTGKRVRFSSQTEAARKLGLQQANVWKVLTGERSHCGGWTFEYARKRDRR